MPGAAPWGSFLYGESFLYGNMPPLFAPSKRARRKPPAAAGTSETLLAPSHPGQAPTVAQSWNSLPSGQLEPGRVHGLLGPCCPGRSPGAPLRGRRGGKCPALRAAEEGLCSPAATSGPTAVFTRLPSFLASPASHQGWEQEAHGPRTPDLDSSLSSSPRGQQVLPDGICA